MATQKPKPNNSRCPDCEWSLVQMKPDDIWKCCNPNCKNTIEYVGGKR